MELATILTWIKDILFTGIIKMGTFINDTFGAMGLACFFAGLLVASFTNKLKLYGIYIIIIIIVILIATGLIHTIVL